MKLLRTEIYGINSFKDETLIVDFTNSKRVYPEEIENREVFSIINNTYVFPVLAFLGINATGKTTTLIMIREMLSLYIQNESLNFNSKFSHYISDSIRTVNYIYHDQFLYKIESNIEKDIKHERLYFTNEKLYQKKLTKSIANKYLFDFNDEDLQLERHQNSSDQIHLSNFLKEEDSVFSSVLNQVQISKLMVQDLLDTTNLNFLSIYTNSIPISYIHYLDPSIEQFELIDDEIKQGHSIKYRLKFYDQEEQYVVDFFNLEDYLSSGTIKGISLLLKVGLTLQSGGYLIIDEIENHLNKTILLSVIHLFNSDLNKHGASLIFTTHYQEMVDDIARTDNIYILRKKGKISCDRFSDILRENDRKDKIKSDLLMSGLLDTAPQYEFYMKLKQDMKAMLEDQS